MKKLLFFIAFITFAFSGVSQTFAPIGATWHYSTKTNMGDSLRWIKIETIADTVFAGKSAKLFFFTYESQMALPCPSDIDTALMAKENDSLFIYENGRWQMLVNFNAVVSDTHNVVIHIPGPGGQSAYRTIRLRVDLVRQVTINNQSLKSVYLANNNSDFGYDVHDGWYTEVIGHEYSPVPWVNSGCAFGSAFIYGRRCYSDSLLGSNTFSPFACEDVTTNLMSREQSSDYPQFYPNPSSGKLFLQTNVQIKTLALYSMDGKLISNFDNWFNGVELPSNSGAYLIKLTDNNGKIQIEKILKY